jgi:two-component system sensor histidine kinase UhpB
VPAWALAQAEAAGHFEAEGWRVRKDGTRFWANVVITPVRDAAGELVGFAKVTRDLTERRQAELKVRQSERRLAEAQHIARLGSWHWNLATGHISWSEELYRIHRLTPGEFDGTFASFLARVHPDDRARVRALIEQARDAGRAFAVDYRIVLRDGTVRNIHGRGEAVVDEAGGLVAMSGTGQDISERKAAEDALRASREQLMAEIAARRRVQQQLEQSREAERARIAREVHDELGGALTALKMGLHRMRRMEALPRALEAPLTELAAEIDATAQIVRRIAHDLRPAVLDDFGILAALEWQFREFKKRSGLAGEWRCEVDSVTLSSEAAIACYRIFQEALTNIARHARASRFEVSITRANGQFVLQVADDGRGLPGGEAGTPGRLGLVGMRERAALVAGELTIGSVPEQGTTVTLRLPAPTG